MGDSDSGVLRHGASSEDGWVSDGVHGHRCVDVGRCRGIFKRIHGSLQEQSQVLYLLLGYVFGYGRRIFIGGSVHHLYLL